jgi:hypothetical protein
MMQVIIAWKLAFKAMQILPSGSEATSHQTRNRPMKKLAFAVLLSALSTAAYADSCKGQATEKKLAGAALNSFMKKCETDAQKSCSTSAAEKKLNGAAKNSFTKKCVTDAVGT